MVLVHFAKYVQDVWSVHVAAVAMDAVNAVWSAVDLTLMTDSSLFDLTSL